MSVTLFFDDEQEAQLRELLDNVPLRPEYISLVTDLLQRLDHRPAAALSSAGSTPGAVSSSPTPGGFQLKAWSPRAVPMVDAINEVLRTITLPHGKGEL